MDGNVPGKLCEKNNAQQKLFTLPVNTVRPTVDEIALYTRYVHCV